MRTTVRGSSRPITVAIAATVGAGDLQTLSSPSEKRRISRSAGNNDTKVHLDDRPIDNGFRVGVGFEVLNGEDANELDNSNEETEAEDGDESKSLPVIRKIQAPEDGNGKKNDHGVESKGSATQGEIGGQLVDTVSWYRGIPLLCNGITRQCQKKCEDNLIDGANSDGAVNDDSVCLLMADISQVRE